MKKVFLFLSFFVLLSAKSGAQDLDTKGLHFVAPTTNGAPSSTVANPESGEIVFDAVNSEFKGYNGSAWVTMDGGSGSGLKTEAVTAAGASVTTSCTSSPCTLYNITTTSWVSVTRSSGGTYVATIASGVFTGNPVCTCSPGDNGNVSGCSVDVTSSTNINILTRDAGVGSSDNSFSLTCTGKI